MPPENVQDVAAKAVPALKSIRVERIVAGASKTLLLTWLPGVLGAHEPENLPLTFPKECTVSVRTTEKDANGRSIIKPETRKMQNKDVLRSAFRGSRIPFTWNGQSKGYQVPDSDEARKIILAVDGILDGPKVDTKDALRAAQQTLEQAVLASLGLAAVAVE